MEFEVYLYIILLPFANVWNFNVILSKILKLFECD